MGVREKIEKLAICDTPNWDDVVRRDDVLAILDEHLGECVGGHTFRSPELAELDIFDGPCPPGQARTIEFEPGDSIVIYRLPPQEDVKRKEKG